MWQQEIVQTNRGQFEVFIKGQGEPLCVTHLYSEFNALGNYFADRFTTHFRVILVNLRETGNSCKAEDANLLSMEETVKDLEAIRSALGYKKWAFGGHSTGGMLGLVYGRIAEKSLTKMIIGGAAASRAYMDHPGSMYCKDSPLNKRVLEIFDILKFSTDRDERVAANIEWSNMSLFTPEKREEYYQKPSSGRTVAKRLDYYSYTELPTFDMVDQLPQIQVPTYVYCGLYDSQCPYVFSEEIARHLPNAKLLTFSYSNHSPFVEEKEAFLEMVAAFAEVEERTLLKNG